MGHHLSATETISKLVATPRWLGLIPRALAGKLRAVQLSHFTMLLLAGYRVPVLHRTITAVRRGKCLGFPVVVRLHLPLPSEGSRSTVDTRSSFRLRTSSSSTFHIWWWTKVPSSRPR